MSDPIPPAPAVAQPGSMPGDASGQQTYPGAPESLIDLWNTRRKPLRRAEGEALPPLDCDLRALAQARLGPEPELPRGASAHAAKRHEIRREMEGASELAALNALLIAHLRKTKAPRGAARLFRRIWAEESETLLAELSPRWLISSVITFGDHGHNEAQRRIGLSMNILFSLMKLYEFERLHSGSPAAKPFAARRSNSQDLPLGMPGFSLLKGGLDINFLAQIWQMAQSEPVAGRIASQLLQMLNDDPGNLFRRLGLMREALRAHRSTKAHHKAASPNGDPLAQKDAKMPE
ncbi:hypothetical protein Q9295_09710 [Xinfangfangia sp. CPCC 101601]|uniref:Uncharacterized protein n=1 Tax=Pseudogemmobacter lacusdianii TaxID=3069608 RepID=A0ABU0VY24_9RHOB|nr:hypothetical protein [Xinfangfangia sp. CPCC 101601]MDQ2066651.1 hypothetical protein [Xinfangfangia sp. CPCC 101601]